MKKFAVAAVMLSAAIATPVLAAEADKGGEARIEMRGGYVTGNGLDDATFGIAGGYDLDLGDKLFAGAEVAGDKVMIDGLKMQFSAGGRVGAKIGNGKLYATGGYTFGQIDDPYAGAGYQHNFGQNLYLKAEYRHQFIGNFGDFDAFVGGIGVAF